MNESLRRSAISITGAQQAARVVMGQDDSLASVDRCISNDRFDWKLYANLIASMERQGDAAKGFIHVRHEQIFSTLI